MDPESHEIEVLHQDFPDITSSSRFYQQMPNVDSSNLSRFIKINRPKENEIFGPKQAQTTRGRYRRLRSFEGSEKPPEGSEKPSKGSEKPSIGSNDIQTFGLKNIGDPEDSSEGE